MLKQTHSLCHQQRGCLVKPHLKEEEKLSVRNLFPCTWLPQRSLGFTAASGVFCKPLGFGSPSPSLLGAYIEQRVFLPLETRMPATAVTLSLPLEVYCDLLHFSLW